jgi:cellulose synthase/poly-beta-1,6-N-acetylglucosamine synthase-like glycosyltransferase
MFIFAVVFVALSGAISVPVSIFFIEVLSALSPFRDNYANGKQQRSAGSVAVIVPAHNEGPSLRPTLLDLGSQLGPDDRLIVVADNCSDETAAIAHAAGAEVAIRTDPTRVGKGYALAHGLGHVRDDPPSFVLFVDADCRVQADMVDRLKLACIEARNPVQACFLMVAAAQSPVDHTLAEFFWIIRNWVRPLGLSGLGLPVQLMGTGMIFPWHVIQGVPLANGNLVEDLKLGLDLAALGHAPRFYPFVVGTSEFPLTKKATDSQRQRWIQGHVGMILQAPRLIFQAVLTRNWDLLVLVLDMAIPPLSMLAPLVFAMLFAGVFLYLLLGISAPVVVALVNFLLLSSGLLLAWLKFGREVISLRDFVTLVPSVFKKLSFYFRTYFGKRIIAWVRTDRSGIDQ